MSSTNIALLHLWILASQAFYMYLSNKDQLKKHRYLFLIAVPIVMAFPVLVNSMDQQAYLLYEYAVIFCIVFAAVTDVSLAAFNKEYLSYETCRSLVYTYFLICIGVSFSGNISMAVKIVPVFLLVSSFLVFSIVKKHSVTALIKSIPLALLSVVCSWAFLRFGL